MLCGKQNLTLVLFIIVFIKLVAKPRILSLFLNLFDKFPL